MKRLGFIYEVGKCLGCKACQVACKDKNQLEIGTFFRRVETFQHEGDFIHFSGGCHHCQAAACLKGCPTGAMHRQTDGTVGHKAGTCIGCGSCIWSCPYGAVKFSEAKGIAMKCNSCDDLRAKGEAPACVQACLTHCLKFGEIDLQNATVHPSFLPDTQITQPSLVILQEVKL